MKNILRLCFIIFSLIYLSASSASGEKIIMQAINNTDSIPGKQLLVVVADGWNNLHGTLYGYNKVNGKWIIKFHNPVVLGEKGLAAGDGIIPLSIENAPVKKEGDMKSPAGIFSIGTAFGYAGYKEANWINNPYIMCTDTLICVDDIHSINYNKLVQRDTAVKDYNSHEEMLLEKIYYKWGLVVNYNTSKIIAGKGSCIFIHIWGNENVGTAGCTAMKEDDMLRILHWIRSAANPLLVQLPKTEYKKYAPMYGLPEIEL